MKNAYEDAQGWIVVTIIGVAIGLNAAFLNIITEWLSDIKMGYCTTAFYLNEKFCCWGEDNGQAPCAAQRGVSQFADCAQQAVRTGTIGPALTQSTT